MTVRLMMGDCLERMADIPDGSVDLVLTDPPYGTTACKWDAVIPFEPMWEQIWRVLKQNGAAVFTATQPFTSALVMSRPQQFKHEWIWHKSKCGSSFTAKFRPLAKHESVLVFARKPSTFNPQMTKGEPYSRTRKANTGTRPNNHQLGVTSESRTVNEGFRYPETVQFFQQKWRRQDQLHPTQKPVTLMEYLIRTYTNPGDTVLDFTMGSGTTGVACVNTGRRFIGIERDPTYFSTAERRIAEAQPQLLAAE